MIVYYSQSSQRDWCAAVQRDTAGQTTEMYNLKYYLDQHPGVKGILLYYLLDPADDVSVNYISLDYRNTF